MSIALAVGLTWASIIVAFVVFQAGRARGRAEVAAQVLELIVPLLPALEQIAETVEAVGDELGLQTKEQLEALRRAAAWN